MSNKLIRSQPKEGNKTYKRLFLLLILLLGVKLRHLRKLEHGIWRDMLAQPKQDYGPDLSAGQTFENKEKTNVPLQSKGRLS